MSEKFVAETISQTNSAANEERLEITFTDRNGRSQTVSINQVTARILTSTIGQFSTSSPIEGPVPTKLPKEFAVGCGRFEELVLMSFENETPYGLDPSQASELGRALVEQSEIVTGVPRHRH